MAKIKSINGEEKEIECIGCAIQKGEIKNIHKILETNNFSVEQDFEIPIPGFIILASKKHIKGIENLDEKERKEFIDLMYEVGKQ
jgi:diadenosine tetraphosphate (Ap4A) HIT family hydrolase